MGFKIDSIRLLQFSVTLYWKLLLGIVYWKFYALLKLMIRDIVGKDIVENTYVKIAENILWIINVFNYLID